MKWMHVEQNAYVIKLNDENNIINNIKLKDVSRVIMLVSLDITIATS